MPLFFYSQADNKDNYRMSITGKLVANMLKKAGVSKVMILDPRTPQLEGFFDGPIDAIKVRDHPYSTYGLMGGSAKIVLGDGP